MERICSNEYLLTAINLIRREAVRDKADSLQKIERFCRQIFDRLSEEEFEQWQEYESQATVGEL